jgi:hypothetical protein
MVPVPVPTRAEWSDVCFPSEKLNHPRQHHRQYEKKEVRLKGSSSTGTGSALCRYRFVLSAYFR